MKTQRDMEQMIQELVNAVYEHSIRVMDRSVGNITDAALGEITRQLALDVGFDLPLNALTIEQVIVGVRDELSGYGPLSRYMRDASVTDILVNAPDAIWIDKAGELSMTTARFRDEEHLQTILERILIEDDKALDVSAPYVDAVMKDGSRVHAVRPPISKSGVLLSIRKFRSQALTLDQLVANEFASEDCLTKLSQAVLERKNIVISGGSGAGKTSFMNWLASQIPVEERVVTIEDAAELNLEHCHTVSLCTKATEFGQMESVDSEVLLRQALRMRADRVIVGEIRGDEVMTLLQCLNIGHEGSMATIHANSDTDVIARMQLLVQLNHQNLDMYAIRTYIANSIDFIVHVEKTRSGTRRISSVSRVYVEDQDIRVESIYTHINYELIPMPFMAKHSRPARVGG